MTLPNTPDLVSLLTAPLWEVTPGFASAENLLKQCISVCACEHAEASPCDCGASFLSNKHKSFEVFACPMAHASELSCPGKYSLWMEVYLKI